MSGDFAKSESLFQDFPNGTIGKGVNPDRPCPPVVDPTKKVHGNSRNREFPAMLYNRFDAEGNFQKWSITQDTNTQYTASDLNGGRLRPYRTGSRSEILNRERRLVERFPGPDNNEPWAGSRTTK